MKHRIERIEQPLLDRIINCALKEFGTHGFERASYNNILNEAGISKGRFYQYVKSKQELFNYLIDSVTEKPIRDMNNSVFLEETDIIKRIKMLMDVTLNIYLKHPNYYMFFDVIKNDIEMANKISAKYQKLREDIRYKNIDTDMFINKSNIEEKVNIIFFSLSSIVEKYLRHCDYDIDKINKQELSSEIDKYVKLFRQLYYKKYEEGKYDL
ncbi:Nucleoid occlusion factor SlmA [Candidatus Izimaplasma bacterium HR1]|jgi:hypothetical protein|uniref:TetR/AcrR family transcriptional regulator n=1 Tax=Candidatus Izimoplasma sp. HR1 TaxID=1541959 RepID=UPI0004F82896|nr:Nucleoid occlusion factor SlmA [Candidatus Izimaplasma bacterium HR1]